MRFIITIVALLALSFPARAVEKLTPSEAYAKSQSGEIILIDIRRPDEWQNTGVAKTAVRLDMRIRDFRQQLEKIATANPGKKLALICQRGVRSANMSSVLEAAGLKNIADVTEGTDGWIAQGLPVSR
jgi:rhodanese-related sulfurtransferase